MSEKGTPLLQVQDLSVSYGRQTGWRRSTEVKVLDGVSFEIRRGTTFGLVGESGSGKSTTALAIMRLIERSGGSIRLGETNIGDLQGAALRQARRRFQMVFQDPSASLNPRKRALAAISEALHLMRGDPDPARAAALFAQVGLREEQQHLYPHQFSGGQRQRIVLARALAAEPELIICDEPVSALDVAVQAQILNLMNRLQQQLGLTYLFISHDLSVIRHMCEEVAVMYLGRIVEIASRDSLFQQPLHPYTRALWSAAPSFDHRQRSRANRIRLQGDPPSPSEYIQGCGFAGRCPHAIDRCRNERPVLRAVSSEHRIACHRISEAGLPLYEGG